MRITRVKSEQTLESMMTPKEVADFLQVSVMTVRRWSRNEQLNGYKLGGKGCWRYRVDDVLDSLREGNLSK